MVITFEDKKNGINKSISTKVGGIVTIDLIGLISETNYEFTVTADNTAAGVPIKFKTLAKVDGIIGDTKATNITQTTATLTADVVVNDDSPMGITFIDTNTGTHTDSNIISADGLATINLTGLIAETSYTFTVTANNLATGKDITFTSAPNPKINNVETTTTNSNLGDSTGTSIFTVTTNKEADGEDVTVTLTDSKTVAKPAVVGIVQDNGGIYQAVITVPTLAMDTYTYDVVLTNGNTENGNLTIEANSPIIGIPDNDVVINEDGSVIVSSMSVDVNTPITSAKFVAYDSTGTNQLVPLQEVIASDSVTADTFVFDNVDDQFVIPAEQAKDGFVIKLFGTYTDGSTHGIDALTSKPTTTSSNGLSAGAIVGIVFGVLFLLLLIAGIIYRLLKKNKDGSEISKTKPRTKKVSVKK
jgi:hypothetical protein